MSIEENDREDLLRDGRTMPLRGQCIIGVVEVMIGFRPQGQVSLYCGPDPVFQFNSHRELRRAYFQGRRYAAERGVLVELIRETRGGKVQFVAKPIDAATGAAISLSLNEWLKQIHEAVQIVTQWQAIEDQPMRFHDRLCRWLEEVSRDPIIAAEPNV